MVEEWSAKDKKHSYWDQEEIQEPNRFFHDLPKRRNVSARMILARCGKNEHDRCIADHFKPAIKELGTRVGRDPYRPCEGRNERSIDL